MSAFFVTTPIYYVNDRPHMGHAYASIHADVVARMRRMAGCDVFFLTGADEHGEKIAKAAAAAGESIQSFVDRNAEYFKDAWCRLLVEPTYFVRTTDHHHKQYVTSVLQRLYNQGEIYSAEYEGLYSIGQERFVTEKDLVDGKLPEDNDPPVLRKEINYFFRMEKHRDWMADYISRHPDLINPSGFSNEILQLLAEPIGDLSISRPASRLSWGIPFPWDPEHVVYVWFDALLSYTSPLTMQGEDGFARWWPSANHIIGKDILRTHTLFWLAMCRAMGIEPYAKLHVSGHLLGFDGRKMSKSLGNGVDPLAAAEKYGADALRYSLVKEVRFGHDGIISEQAIEKRLNNDLASDIGNLASRTVAMINKYRSGTVPLMEPATRRGRELHATAASLFGRVLDCASDMRLSQGFEHVLEFARDLNRYVNESAPWELAKFEETSRQLDEVLFILHHGLCILSLLLMPVMPSKMQEMRAGLGVAHEPLTWWDRPTSANCYRVATQMAPLFKRFP